jgi:uncharacterized protein HemY
VRRIRAHACSSLLEAARTEELSINLADKWIHKPEAEQQEHLRRFRIEKGIRRKARQLVAAHLAKDSVSKASERVFTASDLARLLNQLTDMTPEQLDELGSIEINLIAGPGRAIFVTEELIEVLRPQHEALFR